MTGDLPTYDELPIDPRYPARSAWGVWGEDDNLGPLNLLTPETTLKAKACIQQGKSFPLNWKLESPNPPIFGRAQVKHRYQSFGVDLVMDDVYDDFNTQSSSQWDGLLHVGHSKTRRYYNNVALDENPQSHTGRLGIHHVAERGIIGRAVLLDYARWAETHRPDFDPFRPHKVTVAELDKVAEAQGVTFERGDILLIRYGWIEAYERHADHIHEKIPDLKQPQNAGLEASEETYRWVWEHHFSALAADNFAFEAYPFDFDESCHTVFLSGWGMLIGEMFNLQHLAQDSAKDKVYTYFFTSAPLNKFNGIASPPNAICIK
ncbi:hypothetical protein BY458DRAFT_527671 [Sporodiniella umbellata]|nr:hypothetical protein BY458DRAFT_527671 [Sporodiniella umbellata]